MTLPSLILCPFPDPLSQLPAPQNPKIHLYNAKQLLSWEPVSLHNDTGPVVYHVQFKYPDSSEWFDASYEGVNCMKTTSTECNFTPTSFSKGFPLHFNISLRVRAELEGRVSAWVMAPWFQHYRNGKRIWVSYFLCHCQVSFLFFFKEQY